MHEHLITKLYSELELRGRAKGTIEIYKTEVLKFLDQLTKTLDELTIVDVKEFQMKLIQSNFKPRTINRKMAAVRFFCLFVLEKEWVLMFTPRLKETTTPPSILTSGEVSAVISYAQNLKEKLILMLLYSTGIRGCELVQIKIEDINSNEMLIKINGKNKKIRYVPLISDVLNELRNYWILEVKPRRTGFLFCPEKNSIESIRTRYVYKIFTQALKKAGINKLGGPHLLRHSYATSMLELGVSLREIQIILGHNQSRTTEIYTHLRTVRMKNLPNPLSHILVQVKLVA